MMKSPDLFTCWWVLHFWKHMYILKVPFSSTCLLSLERFCSSTIVVILCLISFSYTFELVTFIYLWDISIPVLFLSFLLENSVVPATILLLCLTRTFHSSLYLFSELDNYCWAFPSLISMITKSKRKWASVCLPFKNVSFPVKHTDLSRINCLHIWVSQYFFFLFMEIWGKRYSFTFLVVNMLSLYSTIF